MPALCQRLNLYTYSEKQHIRFTINCGTYFLYFGILYSKSIILLRLFLVLSNDFFLQFLLGDFKVEYPVNPENDFHTFLVVMYVCLDVKLLKYLIWIDSITFTFSTSPFAYSNRATTFGWSVRPEAFRRWALIYHL